MLNSLSTFALRSVIFAAFVAMGCGLANAQVEAITFSRTDTMESNVAEIDVTFNAILDVEIQVDQLDPVTAFFQNNDPMGRDVFGDGPVTSLGEVFTGDVLNVGDTFGSNSLDVDAIIADGEEFFLGFSSNVAGNLGVGYFKVALNSDTITYSEGFFSSQSGGGGSLIVAIPEPASVSILAIGALVGLARRRRSLC